MDLAPEYVEARGVLLDALDALGRHRSNLNPTGDSELRAAIMTTEQMRLRIPREHLASTLRARKT